MRFRIFIILALVALIVAALPVSAKGRSDRIVLTGSSIDGEMIITDRQVVAMLSMGSLEDFALGSFSEPADAGDTYYELERQYRVSATQFTTFDRARFYPGAGSGPGYVHYLGIENGSSDYDDDWFHARPGTKVAFETLFDPAAKPYVALLNTGHIYFVDPATLEDVADIMAIDDPALLHGFVDSIDTQTFFVDTHWAGLVQHHRVNLADGSVCRVDTPPPSSGELSGDLWVVGEIAQQMSRRSQGTWVEPILAHTDGRALVYHPLGRDHAYDYSAEDRGEIPGGILVVSLSGGRQLDQWHSEIGFSQIITGGEYLYGISAPRNSDETQLYVLDSSTGEILASRALENSQWNLGYGIFDLTNVGSRSVMQYVDRCRLSGWELPGMFRYTMPLLAAGS